MAATTTSQDAGTQVPVPTTGPKRPAKRQQSFGERLLRKRGPGVLAFVAFIVLWQLSILVFDPNPILFPSPGETADEWWKAAQDGSMWEATADSMYAMAIGLAISLAIGIPVGLWIGMSPTTDLITSPYLWGFFAMPRIALAPLMVLWLGFGTEIKIWLVVLSAIIPIILSCKDGVQTTDEGLVRAARSFGAGRLQLFAKVIAPSTLPFIASGIRNGISRGFVGLLVIELTVGGGGIGTQVMRSMRDLDTARMFAFTATLIALALLLVSLSRRLENYASRWREEVVL
jgi:ABC-type nitrate/sulfonate/bicarbonate transport system permease component